MNEFLIKALEIFFSDKIKTIKYLYRQTGIVQEKISETEYRVKINDNIFTVNAYNNVEYNINDVVEVLIENNSIYKVILYKLY